MLPTTRRRLLRLLALPVLLLAAVAGVLLWQGRVRPYAAGERSEGLVDTLARGLPDDVPQVAYTDVAAQAGLAFRHFDAPRSNRLPEDMGSGVAVADVDGDGWPDVFLVNQAGPLDGRAAGWPGSAGTCRLFRNRGDGTFADVTDASGAGLLLLGMGAAFLDADGDGDADLLVSAYRRLVLLLNDGAGHFRDESARAGLDGLDGFWTGLATGDVDRDGDVDAYVCGYVRFDESAAPGADVAQYGLDIPALLNPSAFEPERNLLLLNRGDGSFDERAAAAGVDNRAGRSLAAVIADLDGDLWPDIYVANDVSDNALFLNRGDGSFLDVAAPTGTADYRGAMGLALGDFDGDLDEDLYITHWVGQENALYVNLSPPGAGAPQRYMDQADRFGLGQATLDRVGWATGFTDIDLDGWRDLLTVNGSTIPDRSDRARLEPQRSQLFWNAGPQRGFFDVGPVAAAFFREPSVGRGGALLDLDLDGDEDLLIVRHGGAPALLRHEGAPGGALRLRLRRRDGNTFALGATVRVLAGGREQLARQLFDGSYLSQHALGELGVGLGAAPEAERVTVTWPDGAVEQAGPFPAGSLVTWIAGEPPRVEPLPGRPSAKPASVEGQRAFFAAIDAAGRLRLQGQPADAESAYRQALALWPDHEDALYYLGHVLLEQGREAEALATWERMTRRYPGSSRAWMQVGRARLPGGAPELDDLAAAERAFGLAHRINGEESGPVVQLGVAALLRGDAATADRLLADAAVLNAKSVEARWWRGWIAWRAGEPGRAAALLAEARAAAPPLKEAVAGEGETKSGLPMTADADAGHLLDRWKTLLSRPDDPAAEFAVELPAAATPASR
jgi:tetratricopeptide (TPR) repeat protein